MRIGPGVLAVLIAACTAGDSLTATLPTQDPASSPGGLPATDLDAKVTSVSDGDSFRVRTQSAEIEVRLLGINSPEEDECHGAEAMTALDDLIAGRNISLATEPELDQFDRVLARAVVDDTYVNVAMVRDGHSLVSGPSPDRNLLVEAESEARASELGIWASDVCDASGPPATLEITNIDYNPPGSDDAESVTITNTGGEPIDLEGFVLRDESSVNRFEFPVVILAPGSEIRVVSGCGTEAEGTMAWCRSQPVWNNEGDTALLLDPAGRIVAYHRY